MSIRQELMRKALHLLLMAIPIAYLVFGKWLSVMIFAIIAMPVVTFDYLRRGSPKFNKIFVKIFQPVLRQHEIVGDKLCGASWVAMAACINFAIFKPETAVAAFMILVISDTAAALIGKAVISPPFFEKSFAGSLAFFISGFIVLIACGIGFHANFGFYFFGLFALACVTVIEARPSFLNIDDNFTIPLAFSLITSFFDIIWYYQW